METLQWMSETIEYIGERFPDLTDGDLTELRGIGVRFCKPAIGSLVKAEGDANAA